MKWSNESIPVTSHIYQDAAVFWSVSERVTSIDGDPTAILPTVTGIWLAEKIEKLVYDHYGGFEGFTL